MQKEKHKWKNNNKIVNCRVNNKLRWKCKNSTWWCRDWRDNLILRNVIEIKILHDLKKKLKTCKKLYMSMKKRQWLCSINFIKWSKIKQWDTISLKFKVREFSHHLLRAVKLQKLKNHLEIGLKCQRNKCSHLPLAMNLLVKYRIMRLQKRNLDKFLVSQMKRLLQ